MIRTARQKVPERVEQLYLDYPFEKTAEPMIRKRLAFWRIRPHQAAYQECFDAAMLGYMFSMSRCALCGYEHVLGYLKKMMGISVILALGCLDEAEEICRENQLSRVWVDHQERPDRY